MMGEKWSSLWIPIRVVLGFGLLVPGSSGIAPIQMMVMWLVIQSVGAADSIWNTMVDHMQVPGSATTVPTPYKPDTTTMKNIIERVERPVLEGAACVAYHNSDAATTNGKVPLYTTYQTTDGQGNWLLNFGVKDSASPGCGFITVKKAANSAAVFTAQKTAIINMVDKFMTLASNLVQTVSVSADVDSATTKLTTGLLKELSVSAIGAAIDDYAQGVHTALMQPPPATNKDDPDIRTKMKNEGWIYAGSYYMQLQTIQQAKADGTAIDVNAVLNGIVMPGTAGTYMLLGLDQVIKGYAEFYNNSASAEDGSARVILNANKMFDNFSPITAGPDTPASPKAQDDLGKDAVTEMVAYYHNPNSYVDTFQQSKLNETWRTYIMGFMRLTHEDLLNAPDPMAKLIQYGKDGANSLDKTIKDYEFNMAASGITDAVVQSIATAGGDVAAGLSGGLAAPATGLPQSLAAVGFHAATIPAHMVFLSYTTEAPAVIAVGVAFFTQATMLGVYVPLIPFVMFAFGVLGWFMIVIEAMVAAPIVALGATIPEGNEIYGKAIPALMLITNLFLRPMFMLFGLYGGILLAGIAVTYFTQGFDLIFMHGFGKDPQNAFYWGAVVFMYASLLVMLLQRCFSLISQLPDKVLRWIGDTSSGMGDNMDVLNEARSGVRGGADTGGQGATADVQGGQHMYEGGAQSGMQGGKGSHAAGMSAGKEYSRRKNPAVGGSQPKPPAGGNNP
jgi:defect in organelle trafficking protein DotA